MVVAGIERATDLVHPRALQRRLANALACHPAEDLAARRLRKAVLISSATWP